MVLLAGAYAVAHGSLTIGELVAFFTLMVLLVWPVESLGEILSMGEEAATAAERIYEVFDTPALISRRARRHRAPAPTARPTSALTTSASRFPAPRTPVLRGVNLEIAAGRNASRSSARPGRARPRCWR